MSALSTAGNALFLAALGGAAYFGYYTIRYTTPEMEQLIQERKQPQQDFPGKSVRRWPSTEHICAVGSRLQSVCSHALS